MWELSHTHTHTQTIPTITLKVYASLIASSFFFLPSFNCLCQPAHTTNCPEYCPPSGALASRLPFPHRHTHTAEYYAFVASLLVISSCPSAPRCVRGPRGLFWIDCKVISENVPGVAAFFLLLLTLSSSWTIYCRASQQKSLSTLFFADIRQPFCSEHARWRVGGGHGNEKEEAN